MATAGPNAPGTMADDSAVGTKAWSNVNNAKVADNTYTTVADPVGNPYTSHYLKATNFGFAIPTGATINGVTVTFQRKAEVSSGTTVNHRDGTIKLVKGGTVSGNNKADTATNWSTTEGDFSYGGAADLWGLTLTDTDVNASTFGVVLSVVCTDALGFGPAASVDLVTITITYTAAAAGLSIPVAMQSYRQRRV